MKLVTINSSINCGVFGTAFAANRKTEGKAFNPDPSTWTKTKVNISVGIHNYPAEIAEWTSVKALVAAQKMTISAPFEGDNVDSNVISAVNQKKLADKLEKEEKIQNKKDKARKNKLEELADLAVEKQYQAAVDELTSENEAE